nr:SusD/RagB family nutrient-binding outer membrane lipoprotein [uncultured Draconibacterium sp.]
MKKKISIYISIVAIVSLLSSCSDFGNMNTDPEAITADVMDYSLVFTNVQMYCYGTEYEAWRNGMIYCSTMIQHTASTESYWCGDKYTYSGGYNSAYWDRMFPNGVRNVIDLLTNWEGNEEYYAEYQMARIMKVLLFHRLTDMYGDCPYFEAGKGYYEANGYPVYDTQEVIYTDMLNELKEAATNLEGATSKIGSADIIYGGDVAQWQKFAYSLMLRLSMRLSKVDPGTAQTWVATAVSGGLFESNDDNAKIEHPGATTSNNSCEPFGKIYCHEDPNAYRMSESFVDLLKNTADPRLRLLCTVVEDPSFKIGSGNWELGDTTASIQLGMPNGYDETTGTSSSTYLANAPNYPGSKNSYSVVNRYTYARIDAPTFLVTYAENQLLLAEAAYRGWTTGSAKDYYNAGVVAAMEQFDQFNEGLAPGSGEIAAYLTANPYNEETALEQINTQYYINTFSDEYETFANWRRSGYPELETVSYIGNVTNGTIPRRFTYPTSESSINATNYKAAVSLLNNGDAMTSRVWWDVE